MAVEIRSIEPGEERAFAESVCIPFLEQPTGDPVEACLVEHERERCFAAIERGRMVGNAAVLTRDVTVPGPPDVPCPVVALAAVTSVGVLDLVGEDPEVEAGLWAYLVGVDLVRSVTASKRPVGESVKWRLTDPRAWQTTGVGDLLWLRVLDVPAALGARTYPGEGALVLAVGGEDGDPAVGRWRLECAPDGAEARPARVGEATDLRLGLADLGALYLGGVAASTLAAAGRVAEERAGAAARADRLLASAVAPRSSTGF